MLKTKGELIIINDRYGVRIDKVFASEKDNTAKVAHPPKEAPPEAAEGQEEQEQPQAAEGTADEEFDYSDFELDNQDI